MYQMDDIKSVTIGKYVIYQKGYGDSEALISIHKIDGEGGDMSKAKFEEVIEKFYNENF